VPRNVPALIQATVWA